jgi:hypothetical protein
MEKLMLTAGIIGNVGAWGITWYFVKGWMKRMEDETKKIRAEAKEDAVSLAGDLKGIYIELKLANGRTAKIEGRLETQIAICEERNKKE